ncbi:MAG: DUF1080 domain-containing protein [Verrucomicrobia bacterium]|nr:DUF1080 domain-containing protein [Verrucomicrobiota bacterium]
MNTLRLPSCGAVALTLAAALGAAFAADPQPTPAPWKSLLNGKDRTGWDTYLGRPHGSDSPIGLNKDPRGVFTVVTHDGAPAIRISGEVWGAITSKEEFENFHIRVEYKWGQKKWPPRHEPRHYRDSGILYWCVGEHGAGSGAWMRSVECNIMEKGVGQWWAVAGSYVDIEGRRVVLEKEPRVPYRGEDPGEKCIVWEPGAPRFTTGEGITSPFDPEKATDWNVCEVIAWGNVGVHLLNGQVVLAISNPRFKEGDREVRLTRGKIQIQSEGAEVFYRKIEVRPISEVPADLLKHVPAEPMDETGFTSLFGKAADDGWKQCGPGKFTLENGVATGHDGMGLWWHSRKQFGNFVLRGEFLQEQEIADSGVFFRFPDPGNDPWVAVNKGHEMEIGDPKPEKPTWRTGSIYPFHAALEVPVKPLGQWNTYEIVAIGHNYSVRLNGKLVNTWTDPTKRSLSGYIGLQNYNDGKTVRHRNLRIKELL